MIDRKQFTLYLFKNIGIINLIIGASFFIFGIFNFGILTPFYEAQSGDPEFDGTYTIIVNGGLWIGFCAILMLSGHTFYFSIKNLESIEVRKKGLDITHFFLIAVIINIGLMIYLLLLLMNIVKPLQFYPNVLFAGKETPMDLSIIFNALTFFLILSIIFRISEKFVKYGIQLGGIK